jgi:hypothetical protein
MRLTYHPDAESELIEAAQYYERRVATLGVQFLDDADRAVSMILETPQRWRIIEEDVRSYLMPRFPTQFTIELFLTVFVFLLSSIIADTPIIGGIVSLIN